MYVYWKLMNTKSLHLYCTVFLLLFRKYWCQGLTLCSISDLCCSPWILLRAITTLIIIVIIVIIKPLHISRKTTYLALCCPGTVTSVVQLMDTKKGHFISPKMLKWENKVIDEANHWMNPNLCLHKNTNKDKKKTNSTKVLLHSRARELRCAKYSPPSLHLPPRCRRSQPPEQRGAVPPGSGHGLVPPAQQPGHRLQQVHLAQGHG